MAMTSFPIIYFAVFDWQYEKEPPPAAQTSKGVVDKALAADRYKRYTGYPKYFMTSPTLYRYGIEGLCYSQRLFFAWLAYGAIQAFIIYFTSVRVLGDLGATNAVG